MADEFALGLLKLSVVDVCRKAGLTGLQKSSLETLAEIVQRCKLISVDEEEGHSWCSINLRHVKSVCSNLHLSPLFVRTV